MNETSGITGGAGLSSSASFMSGARTTSGVGFTSGPGFTGGAGITGDAGITGGDGMDEPPAGGSELDASGAARIVRQAGERARRELRVRRPTLFAIWGVVVLVSFGAMWLSVRGQHPYHGPAWPTLLAAFLLFVTAAFATANVVDRAASGVGGRSELQRWIFALAAAAGFAALEIERLAMSHAGAGRTVVSLFGEAIPLLVAGLVLVASSAASGTLNWPRLTIGGWLLAVAAGGAWAGVRTDLAVYALAGGIGILLMAVIEPRLHDS